MFRSESSILSLVSIILVTLVWISLLLGRLYYQSFVESLGLPPSESHLPLLDYALISPNVTILGVGFSVSVAIVIVYALSISIPRAATSSASIFYVIFSLVLIAVPTIILMVLPRESTFDILGSVFFAVALIILFFFGLMAALMYAIGILSTQPTDRSSDQKSTLILPPSYNSSVQRSVVGILIPEGLPGFVKRATTVVLIPILIGAVLIFCAMYAILFGAIDSCDVLSNPKVATVEFKSSDYNERLCDATGDNCAVKVSHIGDMHIYLLDHDTYACDGTFNSEPPRLHAVPFEEVRIIGYGETHDNREWHIDR